MSGAELREALGVAGAGALVPKIIDPQLLEYQRRYAPLVRSIPSGRWNSDVYYFNQRTVNPNGGHVTDGGARPMSNSTYVQNQFTMKHFQIVGGVTGYAQEVTRDVIGDLRAREIEGSFQGMYWDMETSVVWGNSAATQFGAYPQFDGLDSLVNTYSGSNQNAQDKAGATLTLAHLDELADMVETNAAMSVFNDQWMYVLSNTAQSRLAQLLASQQRFVDKTEVAAGLIVPTYRDIPLVKTSFLSTRSIVMGTVTQSAASTGGVLAAGTYSYRVAAVIARQGEIAASVEVTTSALTGATNVVTLAFSTPSGVDGLQPILYKVYRSTSTGTETLLGVVDAVVGLAADGITPIATTSIVDTGATLIAQNGSTQPAQFPPVYAGGNPNRFPPATGIENLHLVSRSRDNLYRPFVRELVPLDVYPTTSSPDTMPFAIVSDTTLALRAPKFLGTISRVDTRL